MSNDWMTRYFKKVTLSGQHAEEWKTLLGLMAVTGAMALARIVLSGLLKHIKSQNVLFVSIGITTAGALLLMYATSYGVSLAAALLIGAGLAAAFPVVLSYIGDLYPAQSGTAFSTIFFHRPDWQHDHQQVLWLPAKTTALSNTPKSCLGCLAASAVLLFLVVKRLQASPGRTAAGAIPSTNPSIQ